MSLRVDATGRVRVGKPPTQKYVVRWQNAVTGKVAIEEKAESLNTLKNYIFGVTMNYNFTGRGTVVRAEIWRTYKNVSKRVYTSDDGIR
ncbi:hypothetical protein [Streptomyces tubercidicus]|uniref:hypothetical protein n=1 Tax=Streptomyces tubercidicus TaxID=47759 RepID=UPI0036AA5D7A